MARYLSEAEKARQARAKNAEKPAAAAPAQQKATPAPQRKPETPRPTLRLDKAARIVSPLDREELLAHHRRQDRKLAVSGAAGAIIIAGYLTTIWYMESKIKWPEPKPKGGVDITLAANNHWAQANRQTIVGLYDSVMERVQFIPDMAAKLDRLGAYLDGYPSYGSYDAREAYKKLMELQTAARNEPMKTYNATIQYMDAMQRLVKGMDRYVAFYNHPDRRFFNWIEKSPDNDEFRSLKQILTAHATSLEAIRTRQTTPALKVIAP
ncbi:MAG: hypothetical protein KGQ41_05465 [Alphaproteobacteria bacterium]|nr:hypothetical protein [Alphaproteobacteria bacterium]